MRRILLLFTAILLLVPSAEARKKKAAAASAKALASTSQNGLFTVTKTEADWFFEIPDSLIGRQFLATVRYTSTPANMGKYGGEQVNMQTVYWQTAPNNKLLLRASLLVNTADTLDAINRAIIISNENPIIGAFKIESHDKGKYKIKVTSFFNGDNQALGLPRWTRDQIGASALLPEESFIESIKTFPCNTEVRATKTYASTSAKTIAGVLTGKVTLGLNISFILLPKEPMRRRLFDPRVGYFSDNFSYYSDNQQRVQKKTFITRWRLEPKDSADAEAMKRGELVEPKKPIIYYIDPATPKQWRPYIIQGVNDWQVAFEQAGFKNAIMAKEWPDSIDSMSMEDARYSVVRYLASPTQNAYGPQVHDPRSGEILESHICWYHNIMTLVHDWYMIQAGTLDEAARQMKYDPELMGELIRFVSSHEVGHTLGLRHNFGASSTVPVDSLRSKTWTEAHGHTPSIMDYARFNYVAQPEDSLSRRGIFPRIGDYDRWAIQWGYTPMWNAYDDESDHWELEKLTSEKLKNNRRLWFGDGETNHTNDSRCQTEDLGDDALKAGMYGVMNLKREIKVLPEWTYESNDINHDNLRSLYNAVVSQFKRYMGHAMKNIGGVYYDYKTVDQDGTVYTNVSRARQKEVLDFLDDYVLNEPTWLIAEKYVGRLVPDKQASVNKLATTYGRQMAMATLRLNAEYPASEYLTDATGLIFKELKSRQAVGSYRRTLQAAYTEQIIQLFSSCDADSPNRPALLHTLSNLQRQLANAANADADTKSHFASLADAIKRALEVK